MARAKRLLETARGKKKIRVLLPETQFPVRLASAATRTFFPFLIMALATASCASIQPSTTGYISENQQRSDKPGANTPKEPGPSPDLKNLVGTWECTVSVPTGTGWQGGSSRVLKIYDGGHGLYPLYGLNIKRLNYINPEITTINGRIMISFRSSASGRVQLTLAKDNWLIGTLTVTDNGPYSMSCAKQ